jgi:hypothetical protein
MVGRFKQIYHSNKQLSEFYKTAEDIVRAWLKRYVLRYRYEPLHIETAGIGTQEIGIVEGSFTSLEDKYDFIIKGAWTGKVRAYIDVTSTTWDFIKSKARYGKPVIGVQAVKVDLAKQHKVEDRVYVFVVIDNHRQATVKWLSVKDVLRKHVGTDSYEKHAKTYFYLVPWNSWKPLPAFRDILDKLVIEEAKELGGVRIND